MSNNLPEDVKLLLSAFGKKSNISNWTLSRIIFDLKEDGSLRFEYDSINLLMEEWENQMELCDFCDNNKELMIFMADYLKCGSRMCNIASIMGSKDILEFLHERKIYGKHEIALASHNCNVEFLKWMYDSELKWDYSLSYLDDIKDKEILEFLENNMENWKKSIFPSNYIKPAKK
jgi:hypothetical protein